MLASSYTGDNSYNVNIYFLPAKTHKHHKRWTSVLQKIIVYQIYFTLCTVCGGHVVRCQTCDREVVDLNPAHVCCVPTPTQSAIPPGSVNEYFTSESWGVNGHTTQCTSPISVVLQLRLVSSWGLQETEISAALWALYSFYSSFSFREEEHS